MINLIYNELYICIYKIITLTQEKINRLIKHEEGSSPMCYIKYYLYIYMYIHILVVIYYRKYGEHFYYDSIIFIY